MRNLKFWKPMKNSQRQTYSFFLYQNATEFNIAWKLRTCLVILCNWFWSRMYDVFQSHEGFGCSLPIYHSKGFRYVETFSMRQQRIVKKTHQLSAIDMYVLIKISNARGKYLYYTVPNSNYFDHDNYFKNVKNNKAFFKKNSITIYLRAL